MSLTDAELFETIRAWQLWNGADYGARIADQEGRHETAQDYREHRDTKPNPDPLDVLRNSWELVERLRAGRWELITEARLRGATWDEIALAVNLRPDEIRNEYAAMVDWMTTHRLDSVDLNRYQAAC